MIIKIIFAIAIYLMFFLLYINIIGLIKYPPNDIGVGSKLRIIIRFTILFILSCFSFIWLFSLIWGLLIWLIITLIITIIIMLY